MPALSSRDSTDPQLGSRSMAWHGRSGDQRQRLGALQEEAGDAEWGGCGDSGNGRSSEVIT
ncbi:hypothetical protein BDA96_01G242200 [Sorghum bicolor]|uniref:Uncharacterized protein n=2 Tax=Sorghum bicolor TaxID=4558 RepID=A0A921S0C5_SORBI|nr:hypothetical protein BDA96_01G242200 [Sorghum bicolor]OQU91680.1 hypothetical protein SORBI_3001G227850 [Sorghum bicolor]